MLNIEEKNNIIFDVENKNYKKWYRRDVEFSYDCPSMASYEDFLKNDWNKTNEKIKITASDFLNEEMTDITLPRFELNWINIDFHFPWFEQTKRSIKVKDFIYLFYNYIFWIDMYSYIEIINNEPTFKILNSVSKMKFFEDNKIYLKEEKLGYVIPPEEFKRRMWKENYEKEAKLWEDWKWKYISYFEDNQTHIKRQFWICPIVITTDDERKVKCLKMLLKKLSPNTKYSQQDNTDKESILKTGEIFDYFIASSKRPSREIEKSKIHDELIKLWKTEQVHDDEIDKWVKFVENFLANIL